jgi:hypothetical protein
MPSRSSASLLELLNLGLCTLEVNSCLLPCGFPLNQALNLSVAIRLQLFPTRQVPSLRANEDIFAAVAILEDKTRANDGPFPVHEEHVLSSFQRPSYDALHAIQMILGHL